MSVVHKDTVRRLLARSPDWRRRIASDYAELRGRGKPALGVSFDADFSGKCQSPVTVELCGRDYRHLGGRMRGLATMEVKCRKCEACLRQRAAHWRYRAKAEFAAATRTWFGTLTFSPDEHSRKANLARAHFDRNGQDYDACSAEERFRFMTGNWPQSAKLWMPNGRLYGDEITLALKRLRKATKLHPRYLLVWEAHQSGLPHAHMLIHETDGEVKHRQLKEMFTAGFTHFKLALDERAATYLVKYLSKSMLARVRASIDYGGQISADHREYDLRHSEARVPPDASVRRDPTRGDGDVDCPTSGAIDGRDTTAESK